MPMKVELYPFAGDPESKNNREPGAFIDIIIDHPTYPKRGIGTVLRNEDLRTLGLQLIAIADAAREATRRTA